MTLPAAAIELSEEFLSLQGEGAHSGLPCWFIRFAGCDLRCRWCDTREAWPLRSISNLRATPAEIIARIPPWIELVQITGGEPLLQRHGLVELIEQLIASGHKVLLETGGHHTLAGIPHISGNHATRLQIVFDIKLPSSAESHHNFAANFALLRRHDEIKFVVADRNDFEAACRSITDNRLTQLAQLLFSPVTAELAPKKLAAWLLESQLPARLQLQLHKIIWGVEAKGV